MATTDEIEAKGKARSFSEKWAGRGDEKQDTQSFWNELLRTVYGIENTELYIQYEKPVKIDRATKFIDGYIGATRVLIEQKGAKIDLSKAEKQSDGQMLTPFQQGRRYTLGLKQSEQPRWIVACNFREFRIHDMERPNDEPTVIAIEDLPKEYERLTFLADIEKDNVTKELEISKGAGELVGKIYDAFYAQFAAVRTPTAEDLRALNVLCVRLVFCFYAEDAGLFASRTSFRDFLTSYHPAHLSRGLKDLFAMLDTPKSERDPFADPAVLAFPYVNGKLFRDEGRPMAIPPITEAIKQELLDADQFDWRDISPTIFGAVFESTLNPETRRAGGMHYTSIDNIHKVIDPLFLDDLKQELKAILAQIGVRRRENALRAFQEKLAGLVFLDPAAGSGNFLTETYLSLRKLENRVISELSAGQIFVGDANYNPIRVKISQFYGIEINDFAVSVAKTALWIAESQMLAATEEIVKMPLNFLPLSTSAGIVEGNALAMDWEAVVPKNKLDYIMGNPPFVGASMMTKKQKEQAVAIYGKIKLSNSIDYVGAWYFKASNMMCNTKIRGAFVSTNSICQGEQVAPLWGTLCERYNTHINFAYRTFIWDSEASEKAHVHCVIIGFSVDANQKDKYIFYSDKKEKMENINAYLLDGSDVFITSRSKPICDVPKMTKGNQPTDGGNLILSEEERDEMIRKDSSMQAFIRPYIGAKDFLNNNEKRYCLWLKDVEPGQYKNNHQIMKRLHAVKEMREKSSAAPTRKAAQWPYKFFSTPQTNETFLIVPRVSSERRRYIPIGFMTPDNIAADSCSIICGADIYLMGVLSSNVHNAWMRLVAGRLKSDYRYSGGIVYNNFPWPDPDEKQKVRIEETARGILDARALYPESSLADLYDEATMPPELCTAHQQNDRAVMAAYGFYAKEGRKYYWYSESKTVAALMRRYQALIGEAQG